MKKCLICGEEISKKYTLCRDCYLSTLYYYEDLDYHDNQDDTINHYNNLYNRIIETEDYDTVIEQCQRLYALAMIIDDYEDIGQIEEVEVDIENILSDWEEDEEDEDEEDFRLKYPKTFRCDDGDYVRSPMEQRIDNCLYQNRIWHIYEKEYIAQNGQVYYPDWFLPDFNLYIEYFGMSKNMNKNEEKRRLFIKDKKSKWLFLSHKNDNDIEKSIKRILTNFEKYNK